MALKMAQIYEDQINRNKREGTKHTYSISAVPRSDEIQQSNTSK